MGLFNITLPDLEFYTLANEDSIVIIDRQAKTVQVKGTDQVFHYQQSEMEKTLLDAGGVLPLYKRFGRSVFREISRTKRSILGSAGRVDKVLRGSSDWSYWPNRCNLQNRDSKTFTFEFNSFTCDIYHAYLRVINTCFRA